MSLKKDVLVLLESSGDEWHEVNKAILSEGNRIARCLGVRLAVLAVGSLGENVSDLQSSGVSIVIFLRAKALCDYQCEVFSWGITQFLAQNIPRLFLMAHSDRGRELAPRIAFMLDTVAVTGCVDIKVREGLIYYTKLMYGGQFEQEVNFLPGLLEIATVMPEFLNKQILSGSDDILVKELKINIPPGIASTKSLGVSAPDFKTVDIVHAKRIIGAGMGAADKGTLELINELSELLRGSLGSTRPVVDEGYFPKERLIGQTGKQVSPELYVALGISGSPHHLAGIQGSERIVSINKDPRAPMHQFSDMGFIGDLKQILPKLIKRIRDWKESSCDEGI